MVGCLYIPEFPAWALQRQYPDRPAVAVHHEGQIIARSRFLNQSGMLLGDPLERARTLFPSADFFSRDIPLEETTWEGVLQQIHAVTPYLQSFDRGVVFFRPANVSEARLLADRLVARVGLAADKSVARIAAVRCAAGSVLHIRADNETQFLSRTKVSVLPALGFDEEVSSRLVLFGLTTLEMTGALTRKHLRLQFGAAGLALFDLLHPSSEDFCVATYVPPPAITEVFKSDFQVRDFVQLSSFLDRMVRRAIDRLGRLCCTHISLRIQPVEDGLAPRMTQRALKNPTSEFGVIHRAANVLLQRVLRTPINVGALRLTLGGLENAPRSQAALFFERPPLSAAIERLDERFPGAAKRALLVRPDAPFPEDSIRFVPFLKPPPATQ